MYRHYCPAKLEGDPCAAVVLLERYAGSEPNLLAALIAKYGPEPVTAPPPLTTSASNSASARGSPLSARQPSSPRRAESILVQSQVEGLVQRIMMQHNGPFDDLIAGMTARYGPEPAPSAHLLEMTWEARFRRFVEAYWATIVTDSIDKGIAAVRAVSSPRGERSMLDLRGGDTNDHDEDDDDRPTNLEMYETDHVAARSVEWAIAEQLDALAPFPGLALESAASQPGARSRTSTFDARSFGRSRGMQLVDQAPLLPLHLGREDTAQLPSLLHVREPILWLSRALVWDDGMAQEPRWRYVVLVERGILILSPHDRVTAVVPLPGNDNRAAVTQRQLVVEATLFQPAQQRAPLSGAVDPMLVGSLPVSAYIRDDDDVCVVALRVRPSHDALQSPMRQNSFVRAFERGAPRDPRSMTAAECIAEQAAASNVDATLSLTLVIPGTFLGTVGGAARDAVAADRLRHPLQRATGPNAGKRFIACLAKHVSLHGGGASSLALRELHIRVRPGTAFSYVRETGGRLGYRLDHELLAAHVREAVLLANDK
jgi:hypothetical protein